jgi:hypothetical protein
MPRSLVVLPFLLAVSPPVFPAPPPPGCATAEARQFDFWLGDWQIDQQIRRADGSWLHLPARTSVSSVLGGCALLEHWEGDVKFYWEQMDAVEHMEGLSVRSYDPGEGEWCIHWMDSRHPRFGPPFCGRFTGGGGDFVQERQTPSGTRRTRIRFSKAGHGGVRWELAIGSSADSSWTPLWIMEMTPARADFK